MRPLLLLSLAALSLAGCATTSTGAASDPSSDLGELKARVLELQRRATMAEVEIDRLRRQVAELELRSKPPGGAGPVAEAPPRGPSPSPRAPLPEAEAAVPGETQPAPPVIESEDLEAVPAPVAEPIEGGVAEEGTTPPSGQLEPISAAAQALYDRGYTLYHQGRYVDAETSFQEFLRDHPATELTDNAQFWIGECRFARGEIEGALDAFRETVTRFPQGNKVADALVKMGDCLRALGDEAGALARYREVLERFPGTGAAAMAEARLP